MKKICLITLALLMIMSIVACDTTKAPKPDGNENLPEVWTESQGDSVINEPTPEAPNDGAENENPENRVTITPKYLSASDFCDGYAFVTYQQDENCCMAIIDTTGKIVYKVLSTSKYSLSGSHLGNGVFVISYEEDNDTVYSMVNKDGEVIASSKNGEFDKIFVFPADGMAVVYKYKKSVTSSAHMYGVIDSTGKFKQPLKEYDFEFSGGRYLGEGIFYLWGANSIFSLYNSNTGSFICRIQRNNYSSTFNASFSNGLIYLNTESWGILNNNTQKYEALPDYIEMKADGTYKETAPFLDYTQGKLIKADGEFIEIYDTKTKKSAFYKEYPASYVESVSFNGDKALLTLQGEDRTPYFTLIDINGKQLIDVIEYCNYNYSIDINSRPVYYKNGLIVYCSKTFSKKINGVDHSFANYLVIDVNSGKVLSDNGANYGLGEFNNEIAKAAFKYYPNGVTKYEYYYVNKLGEKVLETLWEPK